MVDSTDRTENYIKDRREIYEPILKKLVEVPVYNGEIMGAGCHIEGPAVFELVTTTVIIPHNFKLATESSGNLILKQIGE